MTPTLNVPIAATDRIASLDVLRGFALLGILYMNIQSFAMVEEAYMNPTAFGDLTGANYAVWYVGRLFADLKFMSLFSMLFGAGLVLFAERQEAKNKSPAKMHYRRMGWLFLFGFCHAYLIWPGDILVPYACCASLVFLMRNLKPRTQLICGVLVVSVASIFYLLGQWSMPYWTAADLQLLSKEWWVTPDEIEMKKAIYQGPWLGLLPYRAKAAFELETFVFAIFIAWRTGGCMLIGMALYRWEIITGKAATRTYVAMLLGFALGIPLIAYGVQRNFAVDWDVEYAFFAGSQFNYWGSLAVAIGYVALINLCCRSNWFRWPAWLLASVGRMALTNYLMQSIIFSFIFYGHGLGLYSELSRVQQLGVIVAIWIAQLIWSPIWLQRFRFGPFEWLWRSASYGTWQPMIR